MKIFKILLAFLLIASLFIVQGVHQSYGHGLGLEILPPVQMGDRKVSLEVSSLQSVDPSSTTKQITFTLFDVDSSLSLKDVTFNIKATKNSKNLFEKSFTSKYGVLILNLIPKNSDQIQVSEKDGGGFFESILGVAPKEVTATGSEFTKGGLYQFEVSIITADSYSNKLEKPIVFESGLSIPERTNYDINDPNFGNQQIGIITYYDQIENFEYAPSARTIKFSMPFEWTVKNINQTSIVHEEVIIPKTFGDLLVPSYVASINGVSLPGSVLAIDEFSYDNRILHITINQKILNDILKDNKISSNKMDFQIKPSDDNPILSTVTGNGQFRVNLSWEPEYLKSGDKAKFNFYTEDVFLSNKNVAVSYDLQVTNNGETIFSHNAKTSDDKKNPEYVEFTIPKNISGPLLFDFKSLADNGAASIVIPVAVNRVIANDSPILIPDWIRSNAGWWAGGTITDVDFAYGIQFLIQKQILQIPKTFQESNSNSNQIPEWVKNNAGWWAEKQIDDTTFVQGIQYLIQKGIIKV